MLSFKNFIGSLVLFILAFSTCPAHAQEASWEEHSQAGREALDNGAIASAKRHILAAIEAAKVLGPEDPRLGVSLNDLAQVHFALGNYEDAESLLEESLGILTKRLGLGNPWTITTLNNLARLYAETGRYSQAAVLYHQVVKVTVDSLGPRHPNLGVYLNNLAEIYDRQDRFGEAESLYEEALSITRETLGPQHLRVVAIKNNLGRIYREQGRLDEARAAYENALVDLQWPDVRFIAQIGVQHIHDGAHPAFAGLALYHHTVIELFDDILEAEVNIKRPPLHRGIPFGGQSPYVGCYLELPVLRYGVLGNGMRRGHETD